MNRTILSCFGMASLGLGLCVSGAAQTPATGAIEFTAQVRPSEGRPEPVRQMTFYLLRKSLADIRAEVEQNELPPDRDAFIDSLELSPELKAWMKKHGRIELAGSGFTRLVEPDDVLNVPEFFDAYLKQNGASVGAGLPKPRFRESDRVSNPERYQRERAQYTEELRRYIAANPQSLQDLDAALGASNPSSRWAARQAEQRRRIERRVLELAQTRYLAARTDTDLEGRGAVRGLAGGTYWITTLQLPAMAGDARLQWDFPVTVREGEVTRIELSNFNALDPSRTPAN